MQVDIYQHQTIQIENNGALMIWIGSKEDAYKQLDDIYTQAGISKDKQTYLKFCPNIAKIEKELGPDKTKSTTDPQAAQKSPTPTTSTFKANMQSDPTTANE
jgi:hypothetical protein